MACFQCVHLPACVRACVCAYVGVSVAWKRLALEPYSMPLARLLLLCVHAALPTVTACVRESTKPVSFNAISDFIFFIDRTQFFIDRTQHTCHTREDTRCVHGCRLCSWQCNVKIVSTKVGWVCMRLASVVVVVVVCEWCARGVCVHRGEEGMSTNMKDWATRPVPKVVGYAIRSCWLCTASGGHAHTLKLRD